MNVLDVKLVDVDGDGAADGIANLQCSSGAGGTASMVIVLGTKSGTARELPYGKDAEARLTQFTVYRVYEMTVAGDRLVLKTSGHLESDPTCCPTAELSVVYRLGAGGPKLVSAKVL